MIYVISIVFAYVFALEASFTAILMAGGVCHLFSPDLRRGVVLRIALTLAFMAAVLALQIWIATLLGADQVTWVVAAGTWAGLLVADQLRSWMIRRARERS